MVDELIYSELAKSFADGGHFLVRGEHTAAYGFVYPALIAPGVGALRSRPGRLRGGEGDQRGRRCRSRRSRRTCSRAASLSPGRRARRGGAGGRGAVAALHRDADDRERVLPVFLLAALAIVAVARAADAAAHAASCSARRALAYLTRAQAVALLPALADRAAPRLAGRRRRCASTAALRGCAGGACVLVARRPGRARRARRSASSAPTRSPAHVALHASAASRTGCSTTSRSSILSLGVVPFAALVVLALDDARLDRAPTAPSSRPRSTLSFWLVLEVAAFASRARRCASRSGTCSTSRRSS